MKHTFELPKTERTKILTFNAFKENKVQDPKNALKDGGKVDELEKGKDNTSKQGMSKDLKINQAAYESYTEVGDMKVTLDQVKGNLESNVTELQRVSSDLYRKGFETYSEKVDRIAEGITSSLQEFDSVFTDLDNEEPTDVMFPKKPEVETEVVTEAQGADAVKDLDKQIAELEKQKKQHELQAAQLSQQVNQLIIQRANVEIAAAKTNMQASQGQPGQPAQPAQQPTQVPAQATQPTAVPPNPIS